MAKQFADTTYDEAAFRKRGETDEDRVLAVVLDDEELEIEEEIEEEEPTGLSEEELQGFYRQSVDDAMDFVASEIAEARARVQKYYRGETDLEAEEGRSKVVVTKVRDMVRSVMPSIMRAMMQSGRISEFTPRTEGDIEGAKVATEVSNAIFADRSGFEILGAAAHSALLLRTGFVRYWWETKETPVSVNFTNLTDQQLAVLQADDDYTITEQSSYPATTGMAHDVVATKVRYDGFVDFDALPPENCFWDRDATSMRDVRVFGFWQELPKSDLIEMGFDEETVMALTAGEKDPTGEKMAREKYARTSDDAPSQDDTQKEVRIVEAWIRVDADGDGRAELRHCFLGGEECVILLDEPTHKVPVTRFVAELDPYQFAPPSPAEMVIMDQDAQTSLLRAIIDNAHALNNPGVIFNENVINQEDILNTELGARIRARGAPAGQYAELTVGAQGQQSLSVMQYLDLLYQSRTGVTNPNIGLHADALQSTTKSGVDAIVASGQAQVEMMVRNIAQGVADLMQGIWETFIRNADEKTVVKLGAEYVNIDPRFFHSGYGMRVNVGLGTGQPDQKLAVLQQVIGQQQQLFMQAGGESPLMSYENIRNTYTEILHLVGLHNVTDFFPAVPAQQLQEMDKQKKDQAAQAQQGSDPNSAYVQAKQIEVQGRSQVEMAKLSAEQQKALMEDDRKRDEMAMKHAVDSAKVLGDTGVRINQAAVKAEVDKDRTRQQLQAAMVRPPQGGGNG